MSPRRGSIMRWNIWKYWFYLCVQYSYSCGETRRSQWIALQYFPTKRWPSLILALSGVSAAPSANAIVIIIAKRYFIQLYFIACFINLAWQISLPKKAFAVWFSCLPSSIMMFIANFPRQTVARNRARF